MSARAIARVTLHELTDAATAVSAKEKSEAKATHRQHIDRDLDPENAAATCDPVAARTVRAMRLKNHARESS